MARRKYHAAICAIARDEEADVLEWAAYHLALGFEHIFLYDNMSRVPLETVLSGPEARERITITRWPTIPERDSQLAAYEHFLWTWGWKVEWTATIDLDELINLKQHASIGDFLKPFGDADGVALNWRFFGSAGASARRPGLMMERFTRAAPLDFAPNRTVKALFRTRTVARLGYHYSAYHAEPRVYSANGSLVENGAEIAIDETNFSVAQLNHYFVKSQEEWRRKVARGYSWGGPDRTNVFDGYDRNECEDRTILTRKAATTRWMKRLGPSPARALTNRLGMLRRLF